MNTEKPLIKLYRTRTFGEKISDTFDFVRENWRVMLKYITYLLLPIALIQTFCMTNFMTGYMQAITMIGSSDISTMLPLLSSMALYMLVMYVGYVLVTALIYTMMQQYEQRPGLQGIMMSDLKPGVMKKSLRMVVLLLTGIVLMVVYGVLMVLLVVINRLMVFPAILLLLVILPLFVLVCPIYLFENRGVVSAYAKSVRLGWKTWAGIVGVVLVLYIITMILQTVVSMPGYIMLTVKNVLGGSGNATGFVSSFGFTAIQYLLGVISSFCGICLMALITIGIAYQYGHACDKVDGVSVDQDIENFETL